MLGNREILENFRNCRKSVCIPNENLAGYRQVFDHNFFWWRFFRVELADSAYIAFKIIFFGENTPLYPPRCLLGFSAKILLLKPVGFFRKMGFFRGTVYSVEKPWQVAGFCKKSFPFECVKKIKRYGST